MSPEEAAEPGTVVREPQSAQGEQYTLGNLSPSPPPLGGLSSLRSTGRQASFSLPFKLPRHWSKCEGEVSGISRLSTSPRRYPLHWHPVFSQHPIAWSPKYPRPPTAPHFLPFVPFSALPVCPQHYAVPEPETINQVFLFVSNQLQAGFLAMCPPVNVRHGPKGMSCLYAAWLYQLVHGDQMKICFSCFKAAFLVVKNMLEMGDWEEEEWAAEPMELSEAGSEPEEWLGLSWGEGQGHLSHGNSVSTGPGILTSGPVGTEGIGLGPQPVPTELGPQEAVPLDLGPEDAEWTQALPWRFDGLSPCSHWLIPPLSWWDVFNVSPSPGQPVLLELSPIWPMDPLEAEAWLVDLKFVFVLGGFDAICYLLSMTPCWAVRTRVQRWQVLLDPGEVRVAQLQNAPEQQDLHRWRLSILESSELGVELVPADCTLRKGGFKVHSYLPWHSDTPEDWGSEPGERLLVVEVVSLRELPSFRSPSPDSQN